MAACESLVTMISKQFIKSLVPPIVLHFFPPIVLDPFRSKPGGKELEHFLRNGRIPWSVGYHTYHRQLITETLASDAVLDLFRSGKPLPFGYGSGVDERCIEFP